MHPNQPIRLIWMTIIRMTTNKKHNCHCEEERRGNLVAVLNRYACSLGIVIRLPRYARDDKMD